MLAAADREGLRALRRAAGAAPGLARSVRCFSALGEHGGVWVAMGLLGAGLDGGRRRRWLRATGLVVGAYVLNTAIKPLVGRRRPQLDGLPPLARTPTQLSFPSAHATTGFAGARAYARLGLPAGPLIALAATLAGSRVALGVHYPSDILAGAALGTLIGRLA